jgi:hypothetical protein
MKSAHIEPLRRREDSTASQLRLVVPPARPSARKPVPSSVTDSTTFRIGEYLYRVQTWSLGDWEALPELVRPGNAVRHGSMWMAILQS